MGDDTRYDEDFPPDFHSGGRADSPLQHLPGKVLLLAILVVAIGAIGVFTGFATLLGTLATASVDTAEPDYPVLLGTAGTATVLGAGLWFGTYLLWRRSPRALIVLCVFTVGLVLSVTWQLLNEALSFITVISTVMSALVIAAVFSLLFSTEVRDFTRRRQR